MTRSWLSVFYWHARGGHWCWWQGHCGPGALCSCGTQLGTDWPQDLLLPFCTITGPWLCLNSKCLAQEALLYFKNSNTLTFQAGNKTVDFITLLHYEFWTKLLLGKYLSCAIARTLEHAPFISVAALRTGET